MDNATHALAGACLAQCVLGRLEAPRRTELWLPLHLVGVIASNAPDLDILYTGITEGKLGYLLHHRGHTHTAPAALAFGLIIAWLFGTRLPRHARGPLLVVAVASAFLHIAMDYSNSYGVHPWWPLDNHWYYGDSIFIIEPWLFVALAVPIAFSVRTRAMRGLVGIASLIVLAAPWFLPVPSVTGIGVALWTALLTLAWWRHRPQPDPTPWRGRPLALALVGVLTVYALNIGTKQLAVAAYVDATASAHRHAGETPVDLIATPMPATPWCWTILALGTSDTHLISRVARISLLPSLTAPDACPSRREASTAERTAPTIVVNTEPRLRLDDEYRLDLETLQRLSRDCWSAAYLRFARAPFLVPQTQTLGDLRFDRSKGEDFPEVVFETRTDCPRFVPPWIPPRASLLE